MINQWVRYAAAVIILFGIGAYLWSTGKNKDQSPAQGAISIQEDIEPGRAGAVLILSDGTRLELDSLSDGIVAEQNGTKILMNGGQLAYNAENAASTSYNTMTTPKGRQFNIQLPDGSRAWLNAASSITYPTSFTGKERSVSISGEVYLEVARNPRMSFRVNINSQTKIEVLGTSFNVKAYKEDSSIYTTLLEGAVRLQSTSRQYILSAGQQVLLKSDGQTTLTNNADMAKVMAWKNGIFNFEDAPLVEVMRQLERWYDIDVKYAGDPPVREFAGKLPRDLKLSQVLEALQEIGIKFQMKGRTLIISKN